MKKLFIIKNRPEKYRFKLVDNMTLREARDKVELYMITQAIEKHDGNIATTAKMLGISRPTLYHLMKKHGLYSNGLYNMNIKH